MLGWQLTWWLCRITDLGGVSGHVLEAMGSAWAEAGRFDAAIDNYREALACPSANASLHAMEQLGNILVRRAQEVRGLAALSCTPC